MSQRACVIDTTVLQKANAPLIATPREGRCFRERLKLLQQISNGQLLVLISRRLLHEYQRKVSSPRNDYVRAFLHVLDSPQAILNWKKRWSPADKEKARRCRYPSEDDHVFRTAIWPQGDSTIYSKETDMVKSDACVYRRFHVHIVDPC